MFQIKMKAISIVQNNVSVDDVNSWAKRREKRDSATTSGWNFHRGRVSLEDTKMTSIPFQVRLSPFESNFLTYNGKSINSVLSYFEILAFT